MAKAMKGWSLSYPFKIHTSYTLDATQETLDHFAHNSDGTGNCHGWGCHRWICDKIQDRISSGADDGIRETMQICQCRVRNVTTLITDRSQDLQAADAVTEP